MSGSVIELFADEGRPYRTARGRTCLARSPGASALAVATFSLLLASKASSSVQSDFEPSDASSFDDPTRIDDEWFPLALAFFAQADDGGVWNFGDPRSTTTEGSSRRLAGSTE